MLHGGHGAGAAERGADGDFQGDFFIRRPGGVDVRIFDEVFEDFSAWRSGIGGGDVDAGFVSAAGERLIS